MLNFHNDEGPCFMTLQNSHGQIVTADLQTADADKKTKPLSSRQRFFKATKTRNTLVARVHGQEATAWEQNNNGSSFQRNGGRGSPEYLRSGNLRAVRCRLEKSANPFCCSSCAWYQPPSEFQAAAAAAAAAGDVSDVRLAME